MRVWIAGAGFALHAPGFAADLIVVAARPLTANVPSAGLAWLFAGGLCYTGGVIFYARDRRIRFGHAWWHLCVLGGSACHYVAVLAYAV